MKTHRGMRTQFARLTRDGTVIEPRLREFLAKAYELKSIADYETDETNAINVEQAREAVATAVEFVAALTAVLAGKADARQQDRDNDA